MSHDGSPYQFALELYRQSAGGELIGQVPVAVDWEPALEWARFASMRHDPRLPVVMATGAGSVEPVWHKRLGEPYVDGVRVVLGEDGRREESPPIPTSYFKPYLNQVVTALVEKGTLVNKDVVRYLVCAFPRAKPKKEARPALRFSVEEVAQTLPLKETPLGRLRELAAPCGELDELDMPAFIPREVLQEAIELTRKAGPVETGGILIGHLRRDSSLPEIFAEVTAQIPARHAQGELTALTFTADTWTDVEAAIALRRKGEIYLGWWHSHPARAWCKDCPVENRKDCKLSGEFFSAHDVALHRAVFPRAYSIALVVSDSYATGLTWPLFGYRYGLVKQRGYYILGNGAPDSTVVAVPPVSGEEDHVTTTRKCRS
jgi:proteasome lid subunit RPN8/RPN11